MFKHSCCTVWTPVSGGVQTPIWCLNLTPWHICSRQLHICSLRRCSDNDYICRNLFTAPLFHACALYLICCSPVASLLHLPSAAKSSVAKLRTKMKEMKKIACDLFCCPQWDLKNRSPTFFGHSFIFVLNFAIWVFSTPQAMSLPGRRTSSWSPRFIPQEAHHARCRVDLS